MRSHVKIYLKHFDIGESDVWQCERCCKPGLISSFHIHHIYGRGKGKDVIKNLCCLCFDCHQLAHSSKQYVSKSEFQEIHDKFLNI